MDFTIDDFEVGKAYMVEWWQAAEVMGLESCNALSEQHCLEAMPVRSCGTLLKITNNALWLAQSVAYREDSVKIEYGENVLAIPIVRIRKVALVGAAKEFESVVGMNCYAESAYALRSIVYAEEVRIKE